MIQVISANVEERLIYSASPELLEIVDCFWTSMRLVTSDGIPGETQDRSLHHSEACNEPVEVDTRVKSWFKAGKSILEVRWGLGPRLESGLELKYSPEP